jgi:hypothetical protein
MASTRACAIQKKYIVVHHPTTVQQRMREVTKTVVCEMKRKSDKVQSIIFIQASVVSKWRKKLLAHARNTKQEIHVLLIKVSKITSSTG